MGLLTETLEFRDIMEPRAGPEKALRPSSKYRLNECHKCLIDLQVLSDFISYCLFTFLHVLSMCCSQFLLAVQ